MTVQDLGSIGELIAAIATVATLVYLAMQIRQNSTAVKSAAAQSVLTNLNTAFQTASASPELARLIILA